MKAPLVEEARQLRATSKSADPSSLVDVLLNQIEDEYGFRPYGTYVRLERLEGGEGYQARWMPPPAPSQHARWDIEEEEWRR